MYRRSFRGGRRRLNLLLVMSGAGSVPVALVRREGLLLWCGMVPRCLCGGRKILLCCGVDMVTLLCCGVSRVMLLFCGASMVFGLVKLSVSGMLCGGMSLVMWSGV